MASNESFKQAIKAYLDKRAEEDSLFAPKYANEKKSIDECCSYIMGEARKRGNAVAISDEEVYGMAVHYYDEDDIKINRLPAGEKTSVSSSAKPVELTEEDKKAARDKVLTSRVSTLFSSFFPLAPLLSTFVSVTQKKQLWKLFTEN